MKNFDDIMDEQAGRNFTDENAAWDDETACREYEEWLDSDPRRVMDEASGFGVAYVAVSPERYLTPETMPIPAECQPSGETQIYTDYGFFHMRTEDVEARARQIFDAWARDYGYTMDQARAYAREYVRRSIEIAMDPEAYHRSADTEAKRVAREAA